MDNYNFDIIYGTESKNVNVTKIFYENIILNNYIYIPDSDHMRSHLILCDPALGQKKKYLFMIKLIK